MKRDTIDTIYRHYIQDIYCYLLFLSHDHHTSEDLVQETFYRAYLYLEDCKEERIKPWLFKVAYHVFVDDKRKGRRQYFVNQEFFIRLADDHNTEDSLIKQEFWAELRQVVAKLPENQQHALILFEDHELSYQEASDIMGISLAHYKILLFRARQQLRQYREKVDKDE